MRLLEFSDSDYEIHNRTKLDQILVELCHQIIKGKQHDPIKYGMVAACVLDPKNRTVFGINEAAENNKRRHAERVAMDRYVEQHGEIPKGSIIITTLSPCNEYNTHMADERYGESCTDIINNSMVRKVYCGYQDPSQDNEHNEYTLEQTSNSDVKELCKKFADTFLDNAHKNLSENTAAGITKAFNNLGDPVFANLQRVALLAMQGRQSEAAGRLQTVIKDADPAVQKKITDAVNNIKPVTINGRVADSSTLDKSKQHNDWIINTFIPWVQSLLGQQGVAEGKQTVTEYRDRMYQYLKSVVPTWPDYIVKDWLYANYAKGETYNKEKGWSFANVGKDIPMILKDMGLSVDTRWQLVPNVKFTMDMWGPKTLKRLQARAGGNAKSADPAVHIPARDAERHATQAALAKQQGGVRKEPVILMKTADGYELLEGWHRTIQHFAMYPDGYIGPAYIAVAGTVQENFHDGKNPERKGLAKRVGVNTKASVSSLRNTAKHSSGEKQRMAHWLANMKAGRAKK